MKQRTCLHGMTDHFTALPSHGIVPKDGVIYWHIVNFTPDMEKHKVIRSLEAAYAKWQIAFDMCTPKGRVIEFRSTADIKEAHTLHMFIPTKIRGNVNLTRPNGEIYKVNVHYPFDANAGMLAYVVHGKPHVLYDEGEDWGEMYKWEGSQLHASLLNTAIHEIGHTLDIGHSQDRDSIMYPKADGREVLGSDDMDAVQHIWSKLKAKLQKTLPVVIPSEAGSMHLNDILILKALAVFGLKEISGSLSDPQIIAWVHKFFPNHTDDSTISWCSIFLNHIAEVSGLERSKTAVARDWLKIGDVIQWKDRRAGDIVIFWRESPRSWKGHVGVYINDKSLVQGTGGPQGAYIRVLGGNQRNQVTISTYSTSRMIGIRRLNKST